ncbi:P-loop containing nucleoside triphosphate hydrolase protein [Mycena rebaudengoi]|nr:P-loop containing nucleoside triphosphate hydrolase protein [Mycena rebaudengoi]
MQSQDESPISPQPPTAEYSLATGFQSSQAHRSAVHPLGTNDINEANIQGNQGTINELQSQFRREKNAEIMQLAAAMAGDNLHVQDGLAGDVVTVHDNIQVGCRRLRAIRGLASAHKEGTPARSLMSRLTCNTDGLLLIIMADVSQPADPLPSVSSVIPPPFDWTTRRDFRWFSSNGLQNLREKVAPLLDFDLDTFQVECPARLLDGQDVLCITATGSGKTALIYVPLLAREGTIQIVICPTNVLQRDMVQSMEQKGLTCLAINSETLTAADLPSAKRNLWAEAKTGAIRAIFIGPETMKSPEYEDFIANPNVRARLAQFTVDEVHVADEWGVDFRKDFQYISNMRAHLPEHTVFLALSASVEPGRQYDACVKLMGFGPNFHLEKRDCERRNVSMIVRQIEFTHSGHEFRDFDWTIPADLEKASDAPKMLGFCQAIDLGHRLTHYLRTLLPPHLQKDARRLVRHHHSLQCPECKEEGFDSLYKVQEDRDCIIHISTDVLTVGVSIPDLAHVLIVGHIAGASSLMQRAGRPVRERDRFGNAYIYVTKADIAAAKEYLASDEGAQDKRVLHAKDAASHIRVDHEPAPAAAVEAPAPALLPVEQVGGNEETLAVAPRKPATITAKKSSKKAKKTREPKTKPKPGVLAAPGKRTCTALLLVFGAHVRNRCIQRQINMIYGNPGVLKDCGRCSSCVGDIIPKPRSREDSTKEPEIEDAAADSEKTPAYMKPLVRDLTAVGEAILDAAKIIRWRQPRSPDALLIGVRLFLPPNIIRAITTDFLLITSEEIFRARIQGWNHTEIYGSALWEVVEVLVEQLRKDLVARHSATLQKRSDGRSHKWIVANGLERITHLSALLAPP